MYFLGFVGHSGSGKTTLIERLIYRFTGEGLVVGAIKHDAHRFEIDYPGKDSYRMKHAGAKRVVISSSDRLAMVEDKENEAPLEELMDMFLDCDLVFIEGYRLGNVPKIEVHRRNVSEDYLIESGVSNIVLVVTDEPGRYFKVPTRFIDDVDGIFQFVKHHWHAYRIGNEHTSD